MTSVIIDTEDLHIGGKLIVYRGIISLEMMAQAKNDDELKMQMKANIAQELAMYMLDNNLIEINTRDDPNSFSKEIVARAYLAPDDQIRILRRIV
jgi:hypothetical protein